MEDFRRCHWCKQLTKNYYLADGNTVCANGDCWQAISTPQVIKGVPRYMPQVGNAPQPSGPIHASGSIQSVARKSPSPGVSGEGSATLDFAWSTVTWPAPTKNDLRRLLPLIGNVSTVHNDALYMALYTINLDRALQSAKKRKEDLTTYETRKQHMHVARSTYADLRREVIGITAGATDTTLVTASYGRFDRALKQLAAIWKHPMWVQPLVRSCGYNHAKSKS